MKDIKKLIKKELIFLVVTFILFYLFWQIHYLKENPLSVIKLVFGHFCLFILPGYSIMLGYIDKISFIYRIFIGAAVGYSLMLIITYLFNLILKANMMITYKIASPMIILLGLTIFYISIKRRRKIE